MIDQAFIRLTTRLAITQAAQKQFPDGNRDVFQLGIIAAHQMNHVTLAESVNSLQQIQATEEFNQILEGTDLVSCQHHPVEDQIAELKQLKNN